MVVIGSIMAKEFDLVIEAGKTERHYWLDLWRYYELFFFLTWKEILVRYKQATVGIAWSVLQPVLTMTIMVFIFGRVAKLPSGGVPYPVLVFTALLPWQFFSTAFSKASLSLVGNANMISKIYFPRIIIPVSNIMVGVMDFIISFALLTLIMAYYHFVPDIKILLLPFFLLMAFLVALGPTLFISALNVRYRDFQYIVPFMVQIGLYVSPVAYSIDVIPQRFKLIYSLNPMVGVIDGFRWCVLGGKFQLYWQGFIISVLLTFIMLYLGIKYFRATEKTFADKI
jgi:lipopolysaccharide transport system permease protein